MVTFHYVEFKSHCHATEDLDKVKESMENLADMELEFYISEAEGYYGNPINILETKIDRNRDMDEFFDSLDSKVVKGLLNDIERRIDERCNFFFRIDKGKALENVFSLTTGGNSIRVRARVESYPSKRETAIEKMNEYLRKMLDD